MVRDGECRMVNAEGWAAQERGATEEEASIPLCVSHLISYFERPLLGEHDVYPDRCARGTRTTL
jgi:hypothetical protein